MYLSNVPLLGISMNQTESVLIGALLLIISEILVSWLNVVVGTWFWRILWLSLLNRNWTGMMSDIYLLQVRTEQGPWTSVSFLFCFPILRRRCSWFLHQKYKGVVFKVCKMFVCMKNTAPLPLPFVSPSPEEWIFPS